MAIAFPIAITSVEFLTVKQGQLRDRDSDVSSESEYSRSYVQSNLFRGLCLTQAVAFAFILTLQLIAPFTYGSQIFDMIAFEAWLNIFYTIGLFYGICIHLCPTNTGIVCYIGFQFLLGFLAMDKFLSDIHRDYDSFLQQLGNNSYSKFCLIIGTSMSVSNSAVLLIAFCLLLQYVYIHRCKSKRGPEDQDGNEDDENLQHQQV